MKGRRIMTRARPQDGLCQQFIERLGERLERPEPVSNAARIRQMRQAFFADVDALQRAGTVKLPE